jgi:GT2 family glycosyltransferase
MPFSRTHLKDKLLKMYNDFYFHPIMNPSQVTDFPEWVTPLVVPDAPKGQDICYYKLNQFIELGGIQDDDLYMFMCDDDAIERDDLKAIEVFTGEVLFISMLRGHKIPDNSTGVSRHPVSTLIAAPENIKPCSIGIEQIVVRGKILKSLKFNNSSTADGEVAVYLKKHFKCEYAPEIFIKFNYFEPGRWMSEKNITGIVVTHNTKDIFQRAYESVRSFCHDMEIIIIDCSDESDGCFKYVSSLVDDNTRVIHASYNVGHGRGVKHALSLIHTQYALIFDSDIVMMDSPVEKMLSKMSGGVYGVGEVIQTDLGGFQFGERKEMIVSGSMRYLQPYFCLIDVNEYKKYRPFIHHGAPAVSTCLDIHRRGISKDVLQEFPVREYIKHDFYGTRGVRVKKGLPEIEGAWEPVTDSGVTVITCTGDRPLAFSLCVQWMKNQIVKPSQWIIIEDGNTPFEVPKLPYVQYIKRNKSKHEPVHTLLLNLEQAFKYVHGYKILFMEDDEYYAPTYISEMSKLLDTYEVVGIGRSKYYHINGKYRVHKNMGHASLAQTGFRKTLLPSVQKILMRGDDFVDCRIWALVNKNFMSLLNAPDGMDRYISGNHQGYIFEDKKSLYVGIKGLPGRKGIGAGHSEAMPVYKDDSSGEILKQWIPNDYTNYLELRKGRFSHETNSPKNLYYQRPRLLGARV